MKTLASRHDVDWSGVWQGDIPERFTFVDFPDFSRQFLFGLSLLKSDEDLATVADDLSATLAGQNVRYAEVTTTAFTHLRGGMAPAMYRDGLNEGRRRAAARGVDLAWVVDIPRDLEAPESTVTVDFLGGPAAPDGVVGIGLGGYEVGFPAARHAEQFARARALGLHSVPHAGETEGADSVRQALDDLGARRIGHGVRVIEDPRLTRRLADEGILCEVCITSNRLLGVVDTLERHPLPRLIDAGVRVCLNTDDPGWFDTDLVAELRIGSEILGLALEDHLRLQQDALDASYASPVTRRAVSRELEAFRRR